MPDYAGKLVACFLDGELRLALVARQVQDRLHLTDGRGRQHKLVDKHVLLALGPADPAALARLETELPATAREVDTAFLWECLGGREDELSLGDLSQDYFSDRTPAHQAALYLALAADHTRFRVKGPVVQARSPKQVAELQLAQQRQQEKETWRQEALAWLRAAWQEESPPAVSPAGEQLLDRVATYLLRRRADAELVAWLGELTGPETPPHEAAYELLALYNRLPPDADPVLLVAGIEPAFPAITLAAAERLAPYVPNPARLDLSHLPTLSIDDDETNEVDDALSVEPLLDGGCRLGIHIADVAAFVERDDALDQEARRRGATLYLPSRRVTMFPERLSCDLASLSHRELRPCLSFALECAADGTLRAWRFASAQTIVTTRMNYEQADEALAGRGDPAWVAALAQVARVTERLAAERQAAGALTIRRPELKIRVVAGQIEVKPLDPDSPSRRLIGELMILANQLSARYAAEHQVPIIYRAQEPPEQPVTAPAVYDPVATDRLLRQLKRSRLSTHPLPHSALGLAAYTQVTSPLRRFTDLVIQRQLSAHLAGRQVPYTTEELLGILSAAGATEQENKALERQSTRACLLTWLQQHAMAEPLGATVIDSVAGGFLVELDTTCARGRLATDQRFAPGDRVTVRLHQVDPRRNRLVAKLVPPANS